jgi:hypothetical protein
MTTPTKRWFSFGAPGRTTIRCAACNQEFDLGHLPADHHPGACPRCGAESLFFDWHNRPVQIAMESAPPVLVRAIRWCQKDLDELEFTELLCALEELAGEIRSPA